MSTLKRKASDDDQTDLPASKKPTLDNLMHKDDVEIADNNCKDGNYIIESSTIIGNRYYVDQKLGSGGCSTVWQCWDIVDESYIALKIISCKTIHAQAAQHEIDMLRCVKPKKINKHSKKQINQNQWKRFNQLIAYFTICGNDCIHTCLVLEHMEGSLINLFHIPEGRKIISDNIRSIIRQILQGLDYLHRYCQLIHTDLKPDNILYQLERDDSDSVTGITVQIADLGSACSVRNPKSMGFQTYRFRSHEFLLDAPYGPSADIWSMACMAFVLATGDFLFDSEDGDGFSKDEDHLANTISMLGKIPKHVALSGKLSKEFFNDEGKLNHETKRRPLRMFSLLMIRHRWNFHKAMKFADFLLPMLDFDPEMRVSARECLEDPWLADTSECISY